MAHNAHKAKSLSLKEFRLRVSACADSAESILDELEGLLRQLLGKGQIELTDGEHRGIPSALWAVLGVARASTMEAWALLTAAATREENEDDGLEKAAQRAKALFRPTAVASRPGCCPTWDLGTSYLVWRRSADQPGVLVQPSIVGGDGLLLPVLRCPFCGKDAPQTVHSDQLGRSHMELLSGSMDRLGAFAAALHSAESES